MSGENRPSFADGLMDEEDDEDGRVLSTIDPMQILWSGQLTKRGHQIKSWKDRYVEIRGGFFIYWRNEMESTMGNPPRGVALIVSVAPSPSLGSEGLVLTTSWLDGMKRFYLKVQSAQDYLTSWDAMKLAGQYTKVRARES